MYAATSRILLRSIYLRIVRHRFVDKLRQLCNRLIAGKRVRITVGHAFARFAMAAGALIAKDLLAGLIAGGNHR